MKSARHRRARGYLATLAFRHNIDRASCNQQCDQGCMFTSTWTSATGLQKSMYTTARHICHHYIYDTHQCAGEGAGLFRMTKMRSLL